MGPCAARPKVAEQRISLDLKMSFRTKAQDFEKRLANLKSSQSELDFLLQAFGRGELDHCLDRAASAWAPWRKLMWKREELKAQHLRLENEKALEVAAQKLKEVQKEQGLPVDPAAC